MRYVIGVVMLVVIAILVGAALAAPLAKGDDVPAGDAWMIQTRSDTLVTGTGYIKFDLVGYGPLYVDGSAREAAKIWLYTVAGDTIQMRHGPTNLRYDDGPQSLIPAGVNVHLIQFATSDTLKITATK